jgi:hypothetical protein
MQITTPGSGNGIRNVTVKYTLARVSRRLATTNCSFAYSREYGRNVNDNNYKLFRCLPRVIFVQEIF